jgi:hypothetical protein
MTALTVTVRPPDRPNRDQARVPHTAHLRELDMPDGRKLLLDRRAIAFLCEGKPEEFGGKKVTIVGFKTQARACPVTAGYFDLKAWWKGDSANGSKAAPTRLHADAETVLGRER